MTIQLLMIIQPQGDHQDGGNDIVFDNLPSGVRFWADSDRIESRLNLIMKKS